MASWKKNIAKRNNLGFSIFSLQSHAYNKVNAELSFITV